MHINHILTAKINRSWFSINTIQFNTPPLVIWVRLRDCITNAESLHEESIRICITKCHPFHPWIFPLFLPLFHNSILKTQQGKSYHSCVLPLYEITADLWPSVYHTNFVGPFTDFTKVTMDIKKLRTPT